MAALGITLPLLLAALGVVLPGWLLLTRSGRQSLAITWIGLATVPERLGATSVVVGIAGVVGVLVALQAMAAGFAATLEAARRDDTVLVLRAGANAELSSALDRPAVTLIMQAPGIARDARDVLIASAEIVVVANVAKRTTGTDANLEIRGVGPDVWGLRPQVRIASGRRFTPGRRELIVGVFASGDTHESEVWGDAESLMAAYRRNGFQSVTARLTTPAAIEHLRAALAADPRLRVDVETTRAY